MKLLLVIGALTICTSTFSQFPTKDGSVFYEQIDSLPGMSKDEIYSRSKSWIVDIFKDAKEVIQIDSREEGEIVGKGNFRFSYTMLGISVPSRCYFTIKLSSRDGKHRTQIYNVTAVNGERNDSVNMDKLLTKPNTTHNKKIINEINEGVMSMFASLRAALTAKKKDDF